MRDEVDGLLSLSAIDVAFGRRLAALAPFGVGSPGRGRRARVEGTRVLKERHLSLRLGEGGASLDAIAFGQAGPGCWVPVVGDTVEVVCVPVLDVYRGQTRVRLEVERLWPDCGATRDLTPQV